MTIDPELIRAKLLSRTIKTTEPLHVPGIGACWEWTGAKTWGYGHLYLGTDDNGRYLKGRAHRVSYELFIGPIPPGQMICHRCDNRACVNPDHLFLGDHQINADDMVAKGRSTAGVRHKLVELTDADVLEIRRLWAAGGVKQTELALRFRTTKGNISQIVRGKKWRHLLPPGWTPPERGTWSRPGQRARSTTCGISRRELNEASIARFGRTFREEQDQRIGPIDGLSERSVRAKRAHATRRIMAEIAARPREYQCR